MAKQMAFHVDLSACIGCKACQIACKDKNDLGPDRIYRRVIEVAGGDWLQHGAAWSSNAFVYYLPVACMHCENPPCVQVCPTQAMYKRADGVVLIDQGKCIGCGYCSWACPYGAPQINSKTGRMTKCDFCVDYLDQNQPPACVAACGMRVLEYGELSELRAKYGSLQDVFPLPDPAIAKPAMVITPHRASVRTPTEPTRIANPEEI